jgi:sec-independent protein translocase protein TatA
MFSRIGWPEVIFFLVIIVLIFGVGRIGKVAKEIGAGIRGFKDGIKDEENKDAVAENNSAVDDKKAE